MLKPLRNRLIVEVPKVEEVTKAGIIVTGGVEKKETAIGTVVVVGSECLEIVAGSKVLIPEFAGDRYKEDGKDLRILEETDVIALVE